MSKTINGEKCTYEYLNGLLLYETRGEKFFHYFYDPNGTLHGVNYKLTPNGTTYAYYFTHNWRGDIIGIYNGSANLVAEYEYDSWGNVTAIKNANGDPITNKNHISHLNPFRYRGYYMDTETGMYYLMSRYYDPVTHRFLNADGYFQTSTNVLDANMNAYCRNNPVNYVDHTGHSSSNSFLVNGAMLGLSIIVNICKEKPKGNKSFIGASHSTVSQVNRPCQSYDYLLLKGTSGFKSTTYLSYSGTSSTVFSLDSQIRTDDWLASSFNANLKISDFTLSPHLGLGKYGVSGSINSENTQYKLDITSNRFDFTLDAEFSVTETLKWDNDVPIFSETSYTKVTYDGKVAAACFAFLGIFGVAGYFITTTVSAANALA